MDIFAHGLWAAAGGVLARRSRRIEPTALVPIVALAVLPDIVQLIPVLLWVLLGAGTLADLRAYSIALPGAEPQMPALVFDASHHLHCIFHSAIIAGAATLALAALGRGLWIIGIGWWSHIVIDVFTHSADYYAVAVLYPFTYQGFDGIAWNRPEMLALNYVLLAIAWVWIASTRARR